MERFETFKILKEVEIPGWGLVKLLEILFSCLISPPTPLPYSPFPPPLPQIIHSMADPDSIVRGKGVDIGGEGME